MIGRIGLVVVTAFWVTMNVLLWRTNRGSSHSQGSPVSLDAVVDKILTSPDSSTLEVRQKGTVVGFVHWYPDPGEEARGTLSGSYIPSGMVQTPRDLQLRVEGNLSPPNLNTRLHFEFDLRFSADHEWQALKVLGNTRDLEFSIAADQSDREVEWKVKSRSLQAENRVSFEEARDPRKLLGDFAGPLELLAPGLISGPLPIQASTISLPQWEARLDWMPLGSTKLRIYRLKARWLDRYEATAILNRAGEILRIDLPGGWQLTNEGLSGFQAGPAGSGVLAEQVAQAP